MQTALPMSPAKWRKYLKPCYARIYGRCKEVGWWVYMHTDGHCYEVIPDLKDCGVDVINPQIRANGLDNLVATCKGKICVNLDLDRQLFPFCQPEDIDAHIREAVEALGSPEGGLWLSAEIGPDVPLDTIEAICVALEKYRAYYA
jgi:uroporphyrinogen-III decarboxylase